MTIAFRNVEFDPDEPIDSWPYEAIVTMIDRGLIDDWALLGRAIGADPWGPVAQQVEEYLSYATPYGVGPLLRRRITAARERAAEDERADVAAEVRQLVAASGLDRREFARRIGTSASRLSTYCTGQVAPSSPLLVRMRRLVQRVEP
jgi:DNA-binding transcriptional regulator YiaG